MIPLVLLILAPAPTPATTASSGSISIERVDPTVSRIPFDPAHPAADIPKLRGAEAAGTQYDFNAAINVKYDIVEKNEHTDGTCDVVAQLHVVRMKLTLDDRIYLPNNANIPLRSHEEGHRAINERIYESAEPAARVAAEHAIARTWPGSGTNEDAAGKAATDVAVQAIGAEYLKLTARRADHVGNYFDDITQNGTRPINVARAVEMSFVEEQKESAPPMNTDEHR